MIDLFSPESLSSQATGMNAQLSNTCLQDSPKREALLARIIQTEALQSPPAIVLQIIHLTTQEECDPSDVVALLNQEPALCAKILRAVNSCIYGLRKPEQSIARAIMILGLNTVRSLALGLSLSAIRIKGKAESDMKNYWISAVACGNFARELAVHLRRPLPEDDLIVGLLQDIGSCLLRGAFPTEWTKLNAERATDMLERQCELEEEVFGINHAEVSAELLLDWNFPEELVEVIRYHHSPEKLQDPTRAAIVKFASDLTQLDLIADQPRLLEQLLATAKTKFVLDQASLIKFLETVSPKIVEYSRLLDHDLSQYKDYAAILALGTEQLVKLTIDSTRSRFGSSVSTTPAPRVPSGSAIAPPKNRTQEFQPYHLEQLPPSGCRLGQYRLMKELGRGAMGIVFKAFEESLDRHVAVKVLSPTLSADKGHRLRFMREAKAVAAIRHTNIVSIYAVQEITDIPFLVMEYVDGGCLQTELDKHGRLAVPRLLSVALQIAAGLAASHRSNIIHRDIKPGNILVEVTGSVKITDFGLARKPDEAGLTRVGALVGTPHYMAPEVIDGAPASAASDLYALGAVLYTLSVGHPPFDAPNITALLWAIGEKEPVPLGQLRPELPTGFQDVIMRLLIKDPRKRVSSAQDLIATLER